MYKNHNEEHNSIRPLLITNPHVDRKSKELNSNLSNIPNSTKKTCHFIGDSHLRNIEWFLKVDADFNQAYELKVVIKPGNQGEA